MPFDARTLSHRVRQSLVADPLQCKQTVCVGKTKIEIASGAGMTVCGSDNESKPWYLRSSAWMQYASIWTADLDKNGSRDIIILMGTGGCGWAPSSQLLVLMFEKNGRPFPWAVDGYFAVDSHGIKDFVDLNGDGHAELIRQGQDDGYWLTSLYEARQSRWHLLSNISGIRLPLYTRFSVGGNRQAISPPSFRHPYESNLANDGSKDRRHEFIEEIQWTDTEHSQDPKIIFSSGGSASPVAYYSTMVVVLDEPSSRRMSVLSASKSTRKLLNEIVARQVPVTVCGARRRGEKVQSCELVFAQSKCSSECRGTKPGRFHSLGLALAEKEKQYLP